MVREYLDVFPKDKLEFLLQSEVEISMDLVSRTGPISIALYRISLLELVELKKQLEFVRATMSP